MSTIHASELLRPGLLDGVSILLASAPAVDGLAQASLGEAARGACLGLGARVYGCELSLDAAADREEGGSAIERVAREAAELALGDAGSVDLLAVDCASVFAHVAGDRGGASGNARDALGVCLEAAWNVTRAVASRAFLPGGADAEGADAEGADAGGEAGARGGRIVYLAPPADRREHADAACAGLENLARTLSIEWARHSVTTVTIAPGAASDAGEVAALTAYLASPAGAYFSGCLLDLRGLAAGR
jgi:NAD(P)-dependent dehydrogenase (short-subunit alcohol dehydrogenase family)